ncbi:glycine zipper 2TM domain-containing protein [Halomonas garicola]|uniref:glycine zipper 2TM domain-containing protein n=1 Tax=Halomonas garicola TaxID=1690008 RepID=UPI0028970440|nr:glycine zipper 2TM domain-containing protein [Halomonas garicola]
MHVTSVNTLKKAGMVTATLALMLGLAACSNMSDQDRNTAVGAGAGAVGGSVLTGGSTAGTVGGAAVGGVIGHEVDDDD